MHKIFLIRCNYTLLFLRVKVKMSNWILIAWCFDYLEICFAILQMGLIFTIWAEQNLQNCSYRRKLTDRKLFLWYVQPTDLQSPYIHLALLVKELSWKIEWIISRSFANIVHTCAHVYNLYCVQYRHKNFPLIWVQQTNAEAIH